MHITPGHGRQLFDDLWCFDEVSKGLLEIEHRTEGKAMAGDEVDMVLLCGQNISDLLVGGFGHFSRAHQRLRDAMTWVLHRDGHATAPIVLGAMQWAMSFDLVVVVVRIHI